MLASERTRRVCMGTRVSGGVSLDKESARGKGVGALLRAMYFFSGCFLVCSNLMASPGHCCTTFTHYIIDEQASYVNDGHSQRQDMQRSIEDPNTYMHKKAPLRALQVRHVTRHSSWRCCCCRCCRPRPEVAYLAKVQADQRASTSRHGMVPLWEASSKCKTLPSSRLP